MAVSESSCNTMGGPRAQDRADSPMERLSGLARWHIAAARGEIQRAAAVTTATWERARRAMIELLYDRQAQGHAAGQRHHR
ncbi:MAG: hypothetical protein CMLOHMNK_02507 [Steroidobacteraceae bacterium]|nr:hypothetical protein [Steroidobacteraceae bacterium]